MKKKLYRPTTWTEEETNIFLLNYETKTDDELKALLPGKTCRAMASFAYNHNKSVTAGKKEGRFLDRPEYLYQYVKKTKPRNDEEWQEHEPEIFNQKIITDDISAYRFGWCIDSKITRI